MIWDTSIWRLGCSNHSKIRSAQKCYPCLRYELSPMSPGRTFERWWTRGDSNPRPPHCLHFSDYATLHPCGKGFSESSYADLQLYTHGWAGEGKKIGEECLEKCWFFDFSASGQALHSWSIVC